MKNNRAVTALLTGGAGYIGGHVALALHERGWRVIVLDDLSTGDRRALLPGGVFYCGDVGDRNVLDSIFAAHAIDAVVHLAAVASVPESVADPSRCDKVNRRGSETLINTVRRHGAPFFVFSSTSVVYDENGTPPFAEEAALAPISPYAQSKLSTEQYLAGGGAPAFAVLRYFNVGGADSQLRAGNYKRKDTTLIKSALECASYKRPYLCLYGDDYATADGTGVRDYIHVSDIAAAHVLALEYLINGGKPDVFNLGLGRGFSVHEVVAVVKAVSGVDFATKMMPRRRGDPAMIYSDPRKARRVLGFAPAAALEEIVVDAWRWECAYNSG